MSAHIRRVMVVGAGTMGHGIAQVAAQAGAEVSLHDVSQEFIDAGLARIGKNLEKGIEKGKVTPGERDEVLGRISGEADFDAAADGVDLAIEAAPERPELKRDIFERLGRAAPEEAILATNTSSLGVAGVTGPAGRPERSLGMHFFNPPHIMKLLEVVRTEATASETVDRVRAFSDAMGKEMILVKDTPGFATSRLGVVLGAEAIRMLEEGVASAEDIDRAMTLGYRHPMGPLRLTDLVGLDVRLSILEYLEGELGDRFRPPEMLRRMVGEGKLGQKSGEGFYRWET